MDRNIDTTAHDHTVRIARVVWFCAFVLPLILAALLMGVKSAQAAPVPSKAAPLALEEEIGFELEFDGSETAPTEPSPLAAEEEGEIAEEDAAEFAQEECEIAAEEAEEGEITKAEANTVCREAKAEAAGDDTAGSSSTAVGECPIHSTTAHASTHQSQLRLTIGYTTNTPVAATIQIHGIGTFKRHLGRSGVLRFTGETHGRPVVHIKLPASERAECTSHLLVLSPR